MGRSTSDLDSEPTARSADVLLLVLPHWGIVDSWLPVLTELRRRQANMSISAILPSPKKLPRLQRHDFLVDWCNDIFDGVIFRRSGKHWIHASSLEEAISQVNMFPNSPAFEKIRPTGKVVLFDILLEEKGVVPKLQNVFRDAWW